MGCGAKGCLVKKGRGWGAGGVRGRGPVPRVAVRPPPVGEGI